MDCRSFIIDGHNDTMMKVIDEETWLPKIDIGTGTDLHIDLEKLKKGGLNALFFASFSEGYYKDIPRSLSRSLALINALYWTEERNRNLIIASRSGEIKSVCKSGRIAAIPSIEGAYFIDENNYREILLQLKSLGIKLIGFNWNYSNNLGEGVAGVYSDGKTKSQGGITDLGIRVLREMERLGIGVDVSHMNEETFKGVVEYYRGPIIASHSNAHSLCRHRRNLKDYQIQAIRDSGGVVGLTLASSFIKEENPSLDDYLDHLDYLVDLVGIDHVSLGSDFDGASLPLGLDDSSQIYILLDLMEDRGYSEEEIAKFSGLNYLKVLEGIENIEKGFQELDISIESNLNMGSRIKDGEEIRYYIQGLDMEGLYEYRVLLDGREIESGVLEHNRIEYTIDLPSHEFFHIISLEIKDLEKRVKIMSKILYNVS